jgi:predicted nuclease of predicted toxin-antitoxin system
VLIIIRDTAAPVNNSPLETSNKADAPIAVLFIHAPLMYCVAIKEKRPAIAQMAKAALLILVGKDSDIITLSTVQADDIDALLRHTNITKKKVRTVVPRKVLLALVVLIQAANKYDKPDKDIVHVIIFLRPISSIQNVQIIAPGMLKIEESSVSK